MTRIVPGASPAWLRAFVAESNRIEGIAATTRAEVDAHAVFVDDEPSVAALVRLVGTLAPGHRLRDAVGLDVRVGRDAPPPGAPEIRERLGGLLAQVRAGASSPFAAHVAYERLHPFTDGNGRSGRALWLRAMLDRGGGDAAHARELGFLHMFYYQAIQEVGDVQ